MNCSWLVHRGAKENHAEYNLQEVAGARSGVGKPTRFDKAFIKNASAKALLNATDAYSSDLHCVAHENAVKKLARDLWTGVLF